MCLVLGMGAVAASAAETEDLSKKDLVEWAKDVLQQIEDANVREELTAENLEELVREVVTVTNAKITELENFLNEKEDELDEIIVEAKAAVAAAKEKLEKAKKLRETLEEAYELTEDVLDAVRELGIEVCEGEDLLEILDHTIAEAEKALAAAKDLQETYIPNAEVALDKLHAAIELARKAAKKLAPYAETAIEESQPVLDAMFAVYDAVKVLVGEGANAAALELQVALNELASSTVDYVERVTGKRSERLDQLAAKAKAELDQMYREATQAELDCVELSKVVALGDKNAYGPAADKLGDKVAEFMGEGNYVYKNMTVAGQTAVQLRANLDKYAAELKDATVITLSFNTNAFSKYALDKVTSNGNCDWASYFGEEIVEIIAQAKNELAAKLEGKGVEKVAPVVKLAEAYAFAYLQHLASYYPLVRDIHAMNPEAHVVMVGMHNPLEGFSTEVSGIELPLGDFMRYLTDISNIYSLSYAMLSENKLYVNAFEIEVGNEGAYYEHVPTEDGYAEIAQNIWEALGVHDHEWKLVDITDEGEWYECQICGAKKFVPVEHDPDDTGDMIGVVVALLAVSGMGITVLKRREN
jgi:hypothetical protein